MTKAEIRRLALRLPSDDRRQLGAELVASADASAPNQALPGWLQELLDDRLEESKTEPGIPWATVRAEIWKG